MNRHPDKPKPEPLLVNVNEACEMIRISRSQGYEMMRDGSLPYVTVAGRRKIRVSTLRALASGEPEAA